MSNVYFNLNIEIKNENLIQCYNFLILQGMRPISSTWCKLIYPICWHNQKMQYLKNDLNEQSDYNRLLQQFIQINQFSSRSSPQSHPCPMIPSPATQNQPEETAQFVESKDMKFAYGQSDFKYMRQNEYAYVDKSEFAKWIVDSGCDVMLFTRPSGWGKTLNLSMLHYFLQAPYIEQGGQMSKPTLQLFKVVQEQEPIQRSIVQNIPSLSQAQHTQHTQQQQQQEQQQQQQQQEYKWDLRITSNHQNEWQQHYSPYHAAYPVIHLNMATLKPKNYKQAKSMLFLVIQEQYTKYSAYRARFARQFSILDYDSANEQKHDQVYIVQALYTLCRVLTQIFSQKPYLLISHYDTAINYMREKSSSSSSSTSKSSSFIHPQQIQITRQLIQSLISKCACHKKYVHKIIITGLFDILRRSIYHGFKYNVYGIMQAQFGANFGLTRRQIEREIVPDMFQNYDRNNTKMTQMRDKMTQTLKQWYGGYKILMGDDKYLQMYHPASVMHYLNRCIAYNKVVPGESLCLSTQYSKFWHRVFDRSVQLRQLAKFLDLYKSNTNNRVYVSCLLQGELVHRVSASGILGIEQSKNVQELLLFLVNMGCLSGTMCQYEQVYKEYSLTIPNKSVEVAYRSYFLQWLKDSGLVYGAAEYVDMANFKYQQYGKILQRELGKVWPVLGDRNQRIVMNLIQLWYELSRDPTHDTTPHFNKIISQTAKQSKHFRTTASSIFVPRQGKSNKIIIHQYSYTDKNVDEASVNDKLIEIEWMIYEKGYFQEFIKAIKATKLQNIETVEIRPILIGYSAEKQEAYFYMRKKHIQYNIKRCQKISQFFDSYQAYQFLGLFSKKWKNYKIKIQQKLRLRNQFLQRLSIKSLQHLIQEITNRSENLTDRITNIYHSKRYHHLNVSKVMEGLMSDKKILVNPYDSPHSNASMRFEHFKNQFIRKFNTPYLLYTCTLDDILGLPDATKTIGRKLYSELDRMRHCYHYYF